MSDLSGVFYWYRVIQYNLSQVSWRGCSRGVMVKAMVCKIVAREFELQSRSLSDQYPWERYEPPYPLSNCLNNTTTLLLEGWLRQPTKVDMPLNKATKPNYLGKYCLLISISLRNAWHGLLSFE